MNCKKWLVFGAMMAALPLMAASAVTRGDDYSPRQYYGSWEHRRSYSYRTYYYKPTPTYAGYRHHYVISYPHDHKHYYYYNPYKRTFWGRCDAYGEGQPYYSRLPDEYQRSNLSEIPESAFPPQGALPSIPEAQDGGRLDLPPDDGPPPGPGVGPNPAGDGGNPVPPGPAGPPPGPNGSGPGGSGPGSSGPGGPAPNGPTPVPKG